MKKNNPLFFLLLALCMYSKTNAQSTELIWSHSIGSYFYDQYSATATDDNGNIYSTGSCSNDVDLNPGEEVFTIPNNGNIFIQKLNTNGVFQWAKSITPTSSAEVYTLETKGIATDKIDNLITMGVFGGSIDFDPGSSVFEMVPISDADTYVLKLDGSGNFQWAISFLGTPRAITTDLGSNIYVTGTFIGEVDFDPSPSTSFFMNSNDISDDAGPATYIVKFDPDGNFIWAKSIQTEGQSGWAKDISVDSNDNIVLTGNFSGLTDFDPGAGEEMYSGIANAYLLKLDSEANFMWIQILESGWFNKGKAVLTDFTGNVYNTGIYSGTIDFDPSADDFSLTANGGDDIYIQKFSPEGNLLWAKSIGGADADELVYDMSLDKTTNGGIYITGTFHETVDFDPSPAVYELTSVPGEDFDMTNMFVEKIDPDGDLDWVIQIENDFIGQPKSIVSISDGSVVVSGLFSFTADFDPTDGVTELPFYGNHDAFMAKYNTCYDDVFEFSDNTLPNIVAECEVNELPIPTASNGCGGIYPGTTNFSLPITEEGNYTISWTYENEDGDELSQTQTMSVNFLSTEIVLNEGSLSATASGYQYQWVDCNNSNAIIPGATSQDFYPETLGNYAVQITNNDGCLFTSECAEVYAIGINENSFATTVQLYPNPTSGAFTIDFGKTYESIDLKIFNILGEQIKQMHFDNTQQAFINFEAAKAWYFIEIENENGAIIRKKILKK